MYKLLGHLFLSVVLISPVALHCTESKNSTQCSENEVDDTQEHFFALGQTMGDHAVQMAINCVKIAGTDKTKQERLYLLWGYEIVRAIDKEFDNLLNSSIETDFTPEQAALLKTCVTEGKEGMQKMVESIRKQYAQVIQISDAEEKSVENAYAFGTTCAQVYWLLNSTGIRFEGTDQTKAREIGKSILLELIEGITTQLESSTKKNFLKKYQLNQEQEKEYNKLISGMKDMIDFAQDIFIENKGIMRL